MNAEHLDENPLVGPSRFLQPNTNLGNQLHTVHRASCIVHRAQVDHKLTRQATGDLKHFGDIVEVEVNRPHFADQYAPCVSIR